LIYKNSAQSLNVIQMR